jgi:hypothetical protein
MFLVHFWRWRKKSRFVTPTPGALQKSAEIVDWKGVGETLFFEEWGRI